MVIDTVAMKAILNRKNDAWKADNPTYLYGNDMHIRRSGEIRRIEELAVELEKEEVRMDAKEVS